MAVVACASVGPLAPARADEIACEAAPGSTAVMLVGDSLTQGSSGDWTWRYRLWRHLVASDAAVDLVGPRDDLYDRPTATFGSDAYADPELDTQHAARWGASFADPYLPIGTLVASCRPDVVVEALGVNDLTRFDGSAEGTTDLARQFVEEARAADPEVDVVLTTLPQRWNPSVAAYDDLLPGLAAELDTPVSRVVVATGSGSGFSQDSDTYDGLHLTASGEVRMAAGVADALASIGVGTAYPRPLPDVENGPTRPAALEAVARDASVDLRWTLPPGGEAVYVWMRDATAREPWRRLPIPLLLPTTSWTAGGLQNYHDYRFRVQAAKGTAVAEHVFSTTLAAEPRKPAPGPVRLELDPGRGRIVVSWTAARRASSYRISWGRVAPDARRHHRTTNRRTARLTGLARGRYRVAVTPVNDRTRGRTAGGTVRVR